MSEVNDYNEYKIKVKQLEDELEKNIKDLRNKFYKNKADLDIELLNKHKLNEGDIIATEKKTLKIKKFLEYKFLSHSGRVVMVYEVERYTRQFKPSKKEEHSTYYYDCILGQFNDYYSVKVLKRGE